MRADLLTVEQWPVDLFQYIYEAAVDRSKQQLAGYPQTTIETIPDCILQIMLAHSIPIGHS